MREGFIGRDALAVVAALALGISGTPALAADRPLPSAQPLPSHSPTPQVILISLDGAKPQFIERYIASGVLPADTGLGMLREKGARALQNITASPSLTAVSHLAIATGSTAVHNDIPANSFHAVASPLGTGISGFAAPIGGYQISPLAPTPDPTARPLWMALREQGRKVVTATWPGGDGADIKINNVTVQPATPTRTVDHTVPFGAFGGVGAQGFDLTSANFAPDATIADQLVAAGHKSYSPVMVTTAPFETLFCAPATTATCGTTNASGRTISYNMKIAALDTKNDHKTNYDTVVFFDANRGISPGPFTLPATGPAYLTEGKSAPFFFEGSGNVIGTAYFLVNLAPDLSKMRFARYSASYIPRNVAALDDVNDTNTNVGFWAPQPDFRIPEHLSPGFTNFTDEELEDIHQNQVDTFIDYQTDLALRAIDTNPDADLIMIYFEQPDGAKHQYLLTDPRQASDPTNASSIGPGQDRAKVARYARHIEHAYNRANDAVTAIIDKVGTRRGVPRSNIMVVSDHGFAPFHTAVSANNLLAAALTAGGFSPSLINTSVSIRTSGPAANIYVNLAGREAGGTVDPALYQSLVDAISAYLEHVEDPNPRFNFSLNLKKLFGKVYVRPSSCGQPGFCTNANIGQDSGDIVALMDEGYNFDGTQSPGVARLGDPAFDPATTVFSVPNFYGAHGHDPRLPSMSASFYAAGPSIREGVVIPRMRNVDVAPTIMRILGAKADDTVDGAPLTDILK